jgi:hypothetical protein
MIQLEEKTAEALACVQKAETIMAELGHTKYSLSGMCSAAMRHDLEKEVCELLGELAEARKQLEDFEVEATNAINDIVRVKYQRDTLAEALRVTWADIDHLKHWMPPPCRMKSKSALAAVKGGGK